MRTVKHENTMSRFELREGKGGGRVKGVDRGEGSGDLGCTCLLGFPTLDSELLTDRNPVSHGSQFLAPGT